MDVAVSSELSVCMYHTARRYVPEDGYIHCASNLFSAELIKSDKSDSTFQYTRIQKHTIHKRQRTQYYSKNSLATVT